MVNSFWIDGYDNPCDYTYFGRIVENLCLHDQGLGMSSSMALMPSFFVHLIGFVR